jgi:hypothetical protein
MNADSRPLVQVNRELNSLRAPRLGGSNIDLISVYPRLFAVKRVFHREFYA